MLQFSPSNRLTEADYSTGASYAYKYDEVGNREAMTTTAETVTYIYDAANRLTAVGGVSYTHDDNGNLTNDGVYTYTWNVAGRMVGAESVTHTLVYTYNGEGVRVAQSVDGQATTWVMDTIGLAQVLVETSGGSTTIYVYGLGRLAQVEDTDWEWFLGDALGSVRQLVDDNGAVVLARDYTPYGQELSESGTGSSGYGFTGEQFGASFDMLFLRARWYNARDGRFLSQDPWSGSIHRPGTLHKYVYSLDNPMRYVDPSGRTVRSALELIRKHREDIKSVANMYNVDPFLLAGVVFAENRNDYNWIRGQDWSGVFTLGLCGGPEVKNLLSPLVKFNASLGITEISVAVAAMMDNRELVPANYGDMTWGERAELHEQIAKNLSPGKRQLILDALSSPKLSLMNTAQYLSFLTEYRDYGDNYALWLSDYNRGLSAWDSTTEYGRRIEIYEANIAHVLYWQDQDWPSIWVGGRLYDELLYGRLP